VLVLLPLLLLQIEGGFVQGMGWLCLEEMIWGDKAHPWVKPGHLFTKGPGQMNTLADIVSASVANIQHMSEQGYAADYSDLFAGVWQRLLSRRGTPSTAQSAVLH
jgi:hypothetical protein